MFRACRAKTVVPREQTRFGRLRTRYLPSVIFFSVMTKQGHNVHTNNIVWQTCIHWSPRKTDRGVQLYLDGTDDKVVSLIDPQGLRGVEVAGLVHCGVQFCTLPRGVGRSASGLHGAIYIYRYRFLIVSYWCLVVWKKTQVWFLFNLFSHWTYRYRWFISKHFSPELAVSD